MHSLRTIYIAVFLVMCISSAVAQSVRLDSGFDEKNIPIPSSRTWFVGSSELMRAKSILATADFKMIDFSTLRELAPNQHFDFQRMIGDQVESAERDAKRLDDSAKSPDFAASVQRKLHDTAAAYHMFAEYSRRLNTDLKPYLVRATVGGRLELNLQTDVLVISAVNMGPNDAKPVDVYFVTFLERDIGRIQTRNAVGAK